MKLQNMGNTEFITLEVVTHTHIFIFYFKGNISQINEIRKYDGLPPIQRFLLRH